MKQTLKILTALLVIATLVMPFSACGSKKTGETDNTLLQPHAAAIAAGPRKIVIKRPRKASPLGGKEPSYTLSGKKIRYDVIALR